MKAFRVGALLNRVAVVGALPRMDQAGETANAAAGSGVWALTTLMYVRTAGCRCRYPCPAVSPCVPPNRRCSESRVFSKEDPHDRAK
jgi:hypothetical protein